MTDATISDRAIMDAVRDAILVSDAEGRIAFANAAAESLLGYSRGELEGRSLDDVVPERLKSQPGGEGGRRAQPEVYAPEPVPGLPIPPREAVRGAARTREGREVPVEVCVDVAKVDGKSLSVWVLRDLSERVAMESKIKLSDALAATAEAFVVLDATPDPERVPRILAETLVNRLGALASRVWLVEEGEETPVLRAWAGLDPSVDGAESVARDIEGYGLGLAEVLRSRGARMICESFDTPPSSPAWLAAQGVRGYGVYPLMFGNRFIGACAYVAREPIPRDLCLVLAVFARHAGVALHDVSEQLRARQTIEALASQAHARAEEFEAIVSNMPDAVFVVHGDRISFANRTAARMLGVSDPRSLRMTIADFCKLADVRNPDGTPVSIEDLTLTRVLRGEVVTGVEHRMTHVRTGRDIWVQVSGAPLRDPAGKVLGGVMVATEITRLKEFEHSKDEWLAIAAHELRTPLTPITVHLQMAQRRLQMGRPISPEVFEKALEQVKRLSRLVNGLLDVTRLQAGQLELALEDVDMREVAEALVERVRHSAPNHTLVLDVDPQPAMVRGDRARLDEVLSALVDNAIKYSPGGGEVWVSVRNVGREVHIAVRDQGIGIAPEEREQLFERYFRAGSVPHTQYGGLGLGLWIAGKVVKRHGGRIELESEPGVGSTFTVVLPAEAVASEAVEEKPPHKARILVVDDDAAVLDAVKDLLAEDGYDVSLALSGEQALAEARTNPPDVMLLDLRMPGMDGWEVRRRFAADPALSRIPVVLVSADRDARARAAGMDVSGFVAKPFDVEEIERVVGELVKH